MPLRSVPNESTGCGLTKGSYALIMREIQDGKMSGDDMETQEWRIEVLTAEVLSVTTDGGPRMIRDTIYKNSPAPDIAYAAHIILSPNVLFEAISSDEHRLEGSERVAEAA